MSLHLPLWYNDISQRNFWYTTKEIMAPLYISSRKLWYVTETVFLALLLSAL